MIRALALVFAAALLLSMSGCGKKGAPSPPGPADQVTYPRTYPAY